MRFTDYRRPDSVKEAYEDIINDSKAVVVGGGAYLRLHRSETRVAVDLSKLELDYIREDSETGELHIGAMTTLRTMETHPLTKEVFSNIVGRIAGVPIRNIATVGGSICGNYPFSDLMPTLLVLKTKLKFYKAGEKAIEDYMEEGTGGPDILEELILPQGHNHFVAKCFKLTYNDFSISNVAVSHEDGYKIAIGARPGKSKVVDLDEGVLKDSESIDCVVDSVVNQYEFGSDFRAGADYRKSLAYQLLKEALVEVVAWK